MKLSNIINNIKYLFKSSNEYSEDIDYNNDSEVDVFLEYHRILQYLNINFSGVEFNTTKIDKSLIAYNSIFCLTIDPDKCVLALGYDASPIIAAKLTLSLSDIVGDRLYIHDEPYFYDVDRNKMVWGYEEIEKHIKIHNKVRKILPVVVYDDENAGNC